MPSISVHINLIDTYNYTKGSAGKSLGIPYTWNDTYLKEFAAATEASRSVGVWALDLLLTLVGTRKTQARSQVPLDGGGGGGGLSSF